MAPLDRRALLRAGAAAAAAGGLTSLKTVRRLRPGSPNDELRVACVGVRGRGNDHMLGLQRLEGVDVVALVDVDAAVLAERAAQLEALRGASVDTYADVRSVLDRDDVDAVSLATPNHLHALHGVWACQAGKHVYVEKPVSHNVFEGRALVDAAERHGRVVQAGTQSRSSTGIAQGIAWIQAGNLGRIQVARGTCFKPRRSIGKVDGPQPVPPTVDWNLYCGPAPLAPLHRASLHYDWHWQFETGNGDLGNQGIHQVDLCRWAIGAERLPRGVAAFGGRFGYDDDGDTPNTLVAFFDYGSVPILFEVRGLPRDSQAQGENWGASMDQYYGSSIGAVVHCEGGWLHIPDYYRSIAYDREGREVQRWEGADDHFANFVAAVRAGDPSLLKAPIREGHVSSALCHLANISYRVGRRATPDEIRAEVGEHALGREGLERTLEHLAANDVDAGADLLTLGPYLELDPERERFRDDPRACELLTREYRTPFVVGPQA